MKMYRNKPVRVRNGDLSSIGGTNHDCFKSDSGQPDPVFMEDTRIILGEHTITFFPLAGFRSINEAFPEAKKRGVLLGANEAVAIRDHIKILDSAKELVSVGYVKLTSEFLQINFPENASLIVFHGTLLVERGVELAVCFRKLNHLPGSPWALQSTETNMLGENVYSALATPKNGSLIQENNPPFAL